jgi:hypothetical protein
MSQGGAATPTQLKYTVALGAFSALLSMKTVPA